MTLNLDRSEWTKFKFGDVVRNVNENLRDPAAAGIKRVLGLEHLDPGEIHIQRWAEVSPQSTFTRRVRPGQTLFGKRRAYQRKTAYAEFDAVCSGDILVFESADPNRLLPQLLPFIAMTDAFYSMAVETSAGSLSPRTRWSDIAKYEFELPPLDAQRRIAKLLWTVQRHMQSLTTLKASAGIAVHAWFDRAWPNSRLLPIAEIGVCVTGGTPLRAKDDFWARSEVPFFTPSEMTGVVMSPASQGVTHEAAAKARVVPVNSVAVACIGGDMGKAAVMTEEGITNQQITSVTGLLEADAYLLQALLSHPRGRAATHQRESTTIVRKLNKSDLMKVEVPWPEDRNLMRKVVSSARQSERAIDQECKDLETVRSAILSEIDGG